MPIMRIIKTTSLNWWPEASGTVQHGLPAMLRSAGAVSPAKLGHAGADARVHRNPPRCTDTGRNHCSDEAEKGVGRGEVLELPDLWAADTQTGCDTAPGRNRAGVRETGCSAATPWEAEEVSSDERETATAGCFE